MSTQTNKRVGAALILGLCLCATPGRAFLGFGFAGGVVNDASANTTKNVTYADMLNLENVVSVAQVATDEAKKAEQAALEKAIGEKLAYAITLPPSDLASPEAAKLRAEVKRILAGLSADDPTRRGYEALDRQLASRERLAAFRARLEQAAAQSGKPLGLMERMELQNDLNMLRANLINEATVQESAANRKMLDVRQDTLDARRNIDALKRTKSIYSDQQ